GDLQVHKNDIYQLSDEEDKFIWGSELNAYRSLSEKIIDTYGYTTRMEQKKVQRILKFALGRLAMDYRVEKNRALEVHLLLGLSTSEMNKDGKTIQFLKEFLIGRHTVFINGEEYIIEIKSEEYLTLRPQYMGAMIEMSFDKYLNPINTFTKGRVGIVDIGGGSILINEVENMAPSPLDYERFYGIQTIINEIGRQINSAKSSIIEEILRSGDSEDEGYIYRPNNNPANSKDITKIVVQEIEKYTRFTVAPIITEKFPNLEEIDYIIMTGGGSNLLVKESLEVLLEEIGEEYFGRLIFTDESELANARGFYKYGKILFARKNNSKNSIAVPENTSVTSEEKTEQEAVSSEIYEDSSDKSLVSEQNDTASDVQETVVIEEKAIESQEEVMSASESLVSESDFESESQANVEREKELKKIKEDLGKLIKETNEEN
ncbi:MAG: ParM/StbA family protein, partial [Streptococcaceae bacterium]|nr:ParM/StbA family protein [Streptococcaceae bacterium]